MNYKDKTFEIGDSQIKFKNNTFVIYLSMFITLGFAFGFFGLRQGTIQMLFSLLGVVLGTALTFGVFIRLYWKNTIELSNISLVKVRTWDLSIDKDRTFWGGSKYKYHFPTGLNKKTNSIVIFIHRKDKKLAVGFVPDNMENVISVLKEKGVKIITNTSQIIETKS